MLNVFWPGRKGRSLPAAQVMPPSRLCGSRSLKIDHGQFIDILEDLSIPSKL